MSDSEKPVEPKNLPRIVCAFAGLFALAIPAFSVIAGARTQAALGEIVIRNTYANVNTMSVFILDTCKIASWCVLGIGFIAAISLLLLMRKNSEAGTLNGAGRIVLVLSSVGALSVFYLASLLFAAAISVN